MRPKEENYEALSFENLLFVITGVALHEMPEHQRSNTKNNMIAFLIRNFCIETNVHTFLYQNIQRWESLSDFSLMMEIATAVLPLSHNRLLKKNMVKYLQEKLKDTKIRDGEIFH